MKLTKNHSIDHRTIEARHLDRVYKWFVITLLLIAFAILARTLKTAAQTSPNAPEPTITPTPAKVSGYSEEWSQEKLDRVNCEINPATCKPKKTKPSYSAHSQKPHYEAVVAKVKELYPSKEQDKILAIIARESGFNPQAINKSSGACGLVQALPCSKLKCKLTDIDCQLRWQKNYIVGRYGSASKALAWHDQRGWY